MAGASGGGGGYTADQDRIERCLEGARRGGIGVALERLRAAAGVGEINLLRAPVQRDDPS